ncbi:golgin subfamily A member 6-like protein 26 [Palaemon carinicauda]|uniref:golgin subfamily A member 6-like protein 26 n=1 Tax=Palaemon carinicauda TaxID=392227 RepID=UPI0035B5F5AF
MASKLNQVFGLWVNIIGDFVKEKYNWTQNAVSVIQERNAACENMMLNLQGQLQTLQESSVFKWFGWVLPEAPRFGDCRAAASQDGFLGGWLQSCPWIGGFFKGREELRGCELGLRQMKAEALRFNDQMKSRWFVGKLLREFDIGGREDILSHSNKNICIGLTAAGVIFGGIMFAMRRIAKGGSVSELDGEDRRTLVENLEENLEGENNKLLGELHELRGALDEMKTEKEKQEKLITQKETENQKLKIDCAEKHLQMKEQQKREEILKTEREEIQKILNEKIEKLEKACGHKDLQIKEQEKKEDILKMEKEEIDRILNEKIEKLEKDCVQKDLQIKEQEKKEDILKMEKEEINRILNEKIEKLEKDCAQKDLQMKEQEKLLEILKTENQTMKKVQNQKTDQLNQLSSKINELKREKDEQERQKAKMASDYQNLEKAYKEKDLQLKEQKKLLEILKTENNRPKKWQKNIVNKLRNEVEELKVEKEKQEKLRDKMASDYENLKKLCANKDDRLKQQERLLEILKIGHKEPKKFQKDHIIIWKNKVDELNAAKEEQEKLNAKMASDYQNLLKECTKKDLEMKKQERLLEILKTENEATQAQKEQLRNEINKLKAEKQAKDSTKAEKNSDHQEKEKESVKRDSKVNEPPKNEELKKECKKDQEKEKESVKRDSKVNEPPKNEELKKECKKDQEKEKESVKRDSKVNEPPKNEELKKECKKDQEKEKESVKRDSKVNEPPKNEELKKGCKKDQEKEKESIKRDSKVNELPKNEELKKECKKETENKEEDKRGKLLQDGLSAHENKRFDEAMAIFTDALAIDSDNKEQTALLHILRAEANASSRNPQDIDIVLDCCQAVDKGLQGCRAYMLRGKHLLKLGLFDAAMNDFEASRKVEGSRECLKFIEDTKALKKKWESQSHYEVLGVGQTATRADVLKSLQRLVHEVTSGQTPRQARIHTGGFRGEVQKGC